MDKSSEFDDELKRRKRELGKARMQKYRKRKREESQKQNLVSRDESNSKQSCEQIQQNKLERKRELTRERNRRYRENKRLSAIKNVGHVPYSLVFSVRYNLLQRLKMDKSSEFDDELKRRKRELAKARVQKYRKRKREESQKQNLVSRDESNSKQSYEQIQQNKLERKRELRRERNRRYRENKRLSAIKNVGHAIQDSQITASTNHNPSIVQRITINNYSQIAGTSTDMSIPFIVNHNSGIVNDSETNQICGKVFSSKDNRNAHRFLHSDKKPYGCLVCGRSFIRKRTLDAHMQTQGHLNDTVIVYQQHPKIEDEEILGI